MAGGQHEEIGRLHDLRDIRARTREGQAVAQLGMLHQFVNLGPILELRRRFCAAHDGEADLGNGRRDTFAGAHERVHVLAGVDAADGYDQGLLRRGTQAAAHALGADGGPEGGDAYRVIEDLDLGGMPAPAKNLGGGVGDAIDPIRERRP